MHRTFGIALAATLSVVSISHAQTFIEPTMYVWGTHFPSGLEPGQFSNLTNMIMVDAYGGAALNGNTPATQTPDPTCAAQLAAREVIERLYPGPHSFVGCAATHTHPDGIDLTPETVCLTFFGLGRDQADCDETPGFTPSRKLSNVRFFREEDRLPGMLDLHGPGTLGFPLDETDSLRGGPASNRTYRHPFLINAGDPGFAQPPVPPTASPMREWMTKFVQEYRRLQLEVYTGNNGTQRLPDPARVYLDTEASITFAAGSRNQVFMLWWLAQPAQNWIWSSRQVPGYPAGTTLQSLYLAATAPTEYGLPADINDTTLGLLRELPANDYHNRPFMAWWEQVCLRAQSHVLKHSVYDVFHETWPATEADGSFKLKCGNYEDYSVDNGSSPGNTGWFMDWETVYGPDNAHGSRIVKRQTLPRSRIHALSQGSLMYGLGNAATGKRWLTMSPTMTGEVNSPPLYFTGNEGTAATHILPNLYLPPLSSGALRNESLRESGVRVARHTAESILESNINVNKGPLVPWLQQVHTRIFDYQEQPPRYRTIQPEDLEDMLLMLRAKNTPEFIFWTSYNGAIPTAEEQAHIAYAWSKSSEVVSRVYAPRVFGYRPTVGRLAADTPAAMDSSRLEFTLKVNGASKAVGLQSESLGAGQSTGLLVVFSGLDPFCYNTNPVRINIESTVDVESVNGKVLVWDNTAPGRWVIVPHSLEPPPGDVFRYRTPVGVDGTIQARLTCYLNAQLVPNRQFVDSNGFMRLMIMHAASEDFKSRVDLVQVVADCNENPCPFPTCLPPIEVLKGDFDLDGLITPEDLASFLSKWQEEGFLADINLDGVVDSEDLLKYLEDYSEGS